MKNSVMNEDEICSILLRVLNLPKDELLTRVGEKFFTALGYPTYMWRNERVIRLMIRHSRQIMELTGARGKDVLEMGCGMGFNSMIMVLSGAGKVTALDYLENHISMLCNMLEIIDEPLLNERLVVRQGDARKTGLPDNSCDVILALDVLSHCQDLGEMVDEIIRLGRPDGMVYILDGNNGLKLGETSGVVRIQEIAERGPLEEAKREGRCIGFDKTYIEMRREIIESEFPDLDESSVEEMAARTAGLYGEQIQEGVKSLLNGADVEDLKTPYPDVCVVKPLYRHPLNGMWPEIAFSPYKLRDFLKSRGIAVRLIPYRHNVLSGGFKGFLKRQAALLVKLLYPASMYFAPGFEMVGRINKK